MYVGLFSASSNKPAAFNTTNTALHQALDPFENADRSGIWESPTARLCQSLTFNTPESCFEVVPDVCTDTGCVIVSWARLDNRDELAGKLDLNKEQLSDTSDARLLLKSHARWGDACVDHLYGDFSFCLYDPVAKSVFAARDPIGVKPLYFYHSGELLIVASGARVFHSINGLKLSPDPEWISLYILGQSSSFDHTCWPQVKKLPPGHSMRFDAQGKLNISSYFAFKDDSPNSLTRSDHYVEQYREILEESVRCRLRTKYAIGSETSGGIDSSTVTGYAAKYWQGTQSDFHTFGFAFLDREPGYLLETSRQHRVANNHIATGWSMDDDPDAGLQRILTVLGYPEEHSNGSSHEPFYRDCQTFGIRTLLSGFGGDEVVTNSGHLLYNELIDRHKYLLLMANMPGHVLLRPARLLKAIYRTHIRPENRSHLTPAFLRSWPNMVTNSTVNHRYNLRERYISGSSYDAPFRRINDFILHNRLAPFVPTRLDNCTLMAASRKVDYRWPLLDVRLMQQYLSTPSIEKLGKGYGRYLHRRAIEGVVPRKVQWKYSKDMGNPMRHVDQQSDLNPTSKHYKDLIPTLHPGLKEVIDTEKLQVQVAELKNSKTEQAKYKSINCLRQLGRIQALDGWLQRYHP